MLEHYNAFRRVFPDGLASILSHNFIAALKEETKAFRTQIRDKKYVKAMLKIEDEERKKTSKELNKSRADMTIKEDSMSHSGAKRGKSIQMPKQMHNFAGSDEEFAQQREDHIGLHVAKYIAIEEASNLVMKDMRIRVTKFDVAVTVKQIKQQKKKQR